MFFDKLNKKEEGYHSIKETVNITNGEYEGILRHDNVNTDSIMIVDSTGKTVDNYMLSHPENKSWETHIRIFHSKDGKVDIFYETPGDIVDADDINKIQDYLLELSGQGGGEIPQEEIDAILKQIEHLKNNKANKEHTHSANEIQETSSKNFIDVADKLKIQDIDDKADKTEIPKKVSELENDAGFITIDEVPEGGEGGGTSGVSSINGKTGKVTLTGEDVKATSGLFKPSISEEIDRLDFDIGYKADKEETQMQLDNKVERVNNIGGKYVTLYGNLIDTERDSGLTITDAIKEKANKDDVVTSVNGQKGDVVIEGGSGGGSEYVIPRQTTTPKSKEVYIKDVYTKPFEVVVDKMSEDVEQKGNEFIVDDIDGYANVYLSIINGEGELTIYFKNTTSYYSYTHQKINGDKDSSGWVKGDKEVILNVNTGDVISMNTGSSLTFGYNTPNDTLTYELFFEGEPITKEFDATFILEDIGHIKKDISYKADKTDIPTKLGELENDKGYITKDDIPEGGGGSGESTRSSAIIIANYDSHENSKKGADIIINKGENASRKINDAIQSLNGTGGEIKLMEGNYNLEYGIAVNVNGVHLTGIPGATILVQNENWNDSPYNSSMNIVSTIDINSGDQVYISNLIVEGRNIKNSGGFDCYELSQIINCTSNNSGADGFTCRDTSQIINCTSNNSDIHGFVCYGSSQITNCTSNNSDTHGFACYRSSQITNCTSNNNGSVGFSCWDTSQITNCTSSGNDVVGFDCSMFFEGVCSFNVLKGDILRDDSEPSAIVEYNIIKEG